ncbi:dTDP-4-dehydrorhamnose reductase [Roseovarius sp. MBR-78]|jgi:dTDP-4-dehydrorhamnose reductase|uniref:dTDP-4-dehydrorhamnose reductase n=1 Tax=Roseovarius sp. MBR-78 TaxID=3156460 RepID=UPI00339B0D3B
MRVLVFGDTGQLATELARRAPGGINLDMAGRARADLETPETCAALIRDTGPDAVINAAAYTAVDRAEEDEDRATRVNATAPAAMAAACAGLGVPLVHVSTDYVFDGAGTAPWQPGDAPAPLGAYGRSKLAGEVAIRASGADHAILRTSWVVSAHGSNFVRSMLRLGRDRNTLRVVADQIGGPTPASALADACLSVAARLRADPGLTGTYHFAGTPETSWAGFARAIFEMAGIACTVEDIPTTAYPTPARRPLNSRLDCTETQAAFGLAPPDWRAGLRDILTELGEISR